MVIQRLLAQAAYFAQQRQFYDEWLATEPELAPVIEWAGKQRIPLDLSTSSKEWGSARDYQNTERFCAVIDTAIGEDWGVGGYAEPRPFYITDAYRRVGVDGPEWRNVHLGLDIWGPAETVVFSPLAGRVYSAVDNAGERDYGPTLILEHTINASLSFYSLYGHLQRESITHWQVGDEVKQGQPIACFGPRPENGNWPPHLHFQIMLDLLGNKNDFPGVTYASEQHLWLQLCPDPGAWLGPGR